MYMHTHLFMQVTSSSHASGLVKHSTTVKEETQAHTFILYYLVQKFNNFICISLVTSHSLVTELVQTVNSNQHAWLGLSLQDKQ